MPYRRAQLAARQTLGALEVDAVRQVSVVLNEYADNLERIIRTLGAHPERQAALRASMEAARLMDAQMTAAIAQGRLLSFQSSLSIWEEAMRNVAQLEGVSGALLGAVRIPPVTMLGQMANLQAGNHWRTIIRHNSIQAGREATKVIMLATQEGVGRDELARRMRRYVTGAESFVDSFEEMPTQSGTTAKIDLRKMTHAERFAARTMVNSARRIAVSEPHNARSEAEIQHMMSDPFVEAVEWTLAPRRAFGPKSGFTPPDECDYLAINNIWGLGPGVYPVDMVPPPPHPYDRCEKMPVRRPAARMKEPKPKGVDPSMSSVRSGGRIPHESRISDKRAQTIRDNAWNAVNFGRKGYKGGRPGKPIRLGVNQKDALKWIDGAGGFVTAPKGDTVLNSLVNKGLLVRTRPLTGAITDAHVQSFGKVKGWRPRPGTWSTFTRVKGTRIG